MTDRPAYGKNLISQKMGLSEWSYHNDYNPAPRQKMSHVDLLKRFQKLTIEVELGFDAEQTAREVQRCLNCDIETVFVAEKCIECDACIDICPLLCLTIAPRRRRRRSAAAPFGSGHQSDAGYLRVRAAAPNQTTHAQRRGPLRPLRPLRRTLSHRGVGHAEIRT